MILHRLQRCKTNNDSSGYYNTRIKANGENITSTTDQPFDTTPLSVNKVIHERQWKRIQVLGESAISNSSLCLQYIQNLFTFLTVG